MRTFTRNEVLEMKKGLVHMGDHGKQKTKKTTNFDDDVQMPGETSDSGDHKMKREKTRVKLDHQEKTLTTAGIYV